MPAKPRGTITVAAGTNGAGKSVIVGEFLTREGDAYFNPDSYARHLIQRGIPAERANALAWKFGFDGLTAAIDRDESFIFETTLGGSSIMNELVRAGQAGMQLRMFYVGLDSPERHVARVRARVARGGHDIPEKKIRERYSKSVLNLIRLLPLCQEVHVFDNSQESSDGAPNHRVVMRMIRQQIVEPSQEQLGISTPQWAKPIVLAALRLQPTP